MNIRSVIIVITIILAVGGGGFFYQNAGKKEANNDNKVIKKSVIQFIPFPTIISDTEGHKDNSLYDLLINKSYKLVSISDAEIKFDTSIVKLPFNLRGLVMHFMYDQENNRVNFNGHGFAKDSVQISGHYEVTNKNNISYNINIKDSDNSLGIKASYNPNETDNLNDGSVSGEFMFKSSDMFTFLDHKKISKLPKEDCEIALQGDFEIKDNKLTSKNLKVTSQDIDASFNFELLDNNKLKLYADLKTLNLDNIIAKTNTKKFANFATYGFIANIVNLDMDTEIKAQKIIYNKLDLASFKLKAGCIEKGCKLDTLSFTLPEGASFSSKGAVTKNKFRPIYKGDFSLRNSNYDSLTSFLGLSKLDKANSKISMSSAVTISPGLLMLEKLELQEEDSALSANSLKYSFYNENNSVLNADVKINNVKDNAILINSILQNNFLAKSMEPNYSDVLKNHKKTSDIIDATLTFSGLSYKDKKINDLSFTYMSYPDFFAVQDIMSKDDNFDLLGDFSVDLKPEKPYLKVVFKGNKIDIGLFNYLVGSRFYKYYTYSDNQEANDQSLNNQKKKTEHRFSVFRFNEFDGQIRVKVKNDDTQSISSIDCQASIDKGNLNIQPCNIGAFGGKFNIENGVIKLGKDLSYEGKYNWKDVDVNLLINSLRKNFYPKLFITGNGRVNLSGHKASHGNSVEEFISNADAKFNLKSTNRVHINNLNISSIINTYGNPKIKNKKPTTKATKDKKQTAHKFLNENMTIFKQLGGDFVIDQGMVKSNNFYFVTQDNIHGQTVIDYDLLSEQIKGMLSLAYLKNNEKIDGFNLSFSGKTNNLKVRLGAN
jgi:hypothetical protein